ncbi:CobW/P47K family protein [Gregarina niphandrodes]|uniref:CobW/P47K family protein n=1 Tax=Gregarina niphandrodes TaxID=110365 RepID=A0A023BC18_GRENI|nr:CobW/P47K family protein [Gregarina niphandrodes]EZG81118.1 CobW/P47K family protein [Gregarina niphandrodes]|eukprot:XP_011134265.1 CobW/P47K family protein [Gregarina niphandrodes]
MPVTPVIILSGFLGSGKTTLLKNLLENVDGHRIAVVRNEFSDGPMDFEAPLLVEEDEDIGVVMELPNTCVCCSAKSYFVASINNLIKKNKGAPFDFVIAEISGLTDPIAVADEFISSFDPVDDLARLTALVTVLDAHRTSLLLPGHVSTTDSPGPARTSTTTPGPPSRMAASPVAASRTATSSDGAATSGQAEEGGGGSKAVEGEHQLSCSELLVRFLVSADMVLCNKVDLIAAEERVCHLRKWHSRIRAMAPDAMIVDTVYSNVPIGSLLRLARSNPGCTCCVGEATCRYSQEAPTSLVRVLSRDKGDSKSLDLEKLLGDHGLLSADLSDDYFYAGITQPVSSYPEPHEWVHGISRVVIGGRTSADIVLSTEQLTELECRLCNWVWETKPLLYRAKGLIQTNTNHWAELQICGESVAISNLDNATISKQNTHFCWVQLRQQGSVSCK